MIICDSTNMHLLLGFLNAFVFGVHTSRAAPSSLASEYDPSTLDIFSSDQSELDAPDMGNPSDFSSYLNNNQDLGLIASNDQLDWSTDDISYLNNGGDDNIQPEPDLFGANPACTFGDAGTPGFARKRELPSESCPNLLAPPDGATQAPSKERTPKTEPPDPTRPPDPNNPGLPYIDHADLGDFYTERDQETIRGYYPPRSPDSICGNELFTVCDSGDPYWRIPQVPPKYALKNCFTCMYVILAEPLIAKRYELTTTQQKETPYFPTLSGWH